MTLESKSLIVTIVKKGDGDTVIEASMKAGATGGTIMFGRGIGVRERKKILGVPIEPEKEIVFTLVPSESVQPVLDEIVQAVKLGEPGRGVVFTLTLDRLTGCAHALVEEMCEEAAEKTEAPADSDNRPEDTDKPAS
jgi:nitrogen regulatory protein P-II 1